MHRPSCSKAPDAPVAQTYTRLSGKRQALAGPLVMNPIDACPKRPAIPRRYIGSASVRRNTQQMIFRVLGVVRCADTPPPPPRANPKAPNTQKPAHFP